MDIKMILSFEQGIRGYLNEHGRWYPSVSAVLDILSPAPMEWIDQADLDEGTRLHALAVEAVKAERREMPKEPRVHVFLKWYWEQGYRLLCAETPKGSKILGFAGCADFVVLDLAGREEVIDLKFAESLSVRYEAQLAAYKRLYQAKRTRLVQIPKDTTKIKTPLMPKDDVHWSAFLGALSVLKWRMRK